MTTYTLKDSVNAFFIHSTEEQLEEFMRLYRIFKRTKKKRAKRKIAKRIGEMEVQVGGELEE